MREAQYQLLTPGRCHCLDEDPANSGVRTDLVSTNSIRLLPADLYLNDINQRFSAVYVGMVIPAGSYEGFDEEVGTIRAPNFLLANESLDEELAYQVTRVLFEQQEALAEAHPEAEKLDLEGAQSVAPLELHPGARRYYEEASGSSGVIAPLLPLFTGVATLFALMDEEPRWSIDTGGTTNYSGSEDGERIRRCPTNAQVSARANV